MLPGRLAGTRVAVPDRNCFQSLRAGRAAELLGSLRPLAWLAGQLDRYEASGLRRLPRRRRATRAPSLSRSGRQSSAKAAPPISGRDIDPLRPLCRASRRRARRPRSRRRAARPALERGAVAVEPPRDPAHGDLATNAAMVLAKRAGTNPRALAELIVPRLGGARRGRRAPRSPGPGFINIRLDRAVWEEELRDDPRRGRRLWPLGHGRRPARQCRICLGQPDRADAHGPLPRRGGRRRAGQPARICRPHGDPRILCQRRRRPGRRARPLGAPALPRGARRGRSARSPKASIPATI